MIGQPAQAAAPPLEVKVHKLEVSYHWALAIAMVAVVALVAVLGWTAYTAVSVPDGQKVATELLAAWNAGEPAQLETVYAEDAVLVSAGGVKYEGIAAIKGIGSTLASFDFTAEATGLVTQSGRTLVIPIHQTWSTGEEAWVTTILELDSAGKIVHHQDYGKP